MTPMVWVMAPGVQPEMLGFVPTFLSEDDERTAAQQFDSNYRHGGGWRPFGRWVLDEVSHVLKYPGDPPLEPLAFAKPHGKETVIFYEHAIVCIVQPDGSFEVARLD